MQAQQKCLQSCIYPCKRFPQCCFIVRLFSRALCCLAFHTFPLWSFQGAVEKTLCTLKIEQCKRLNYLSKKRSDLGMLHKACDLVRSPSKGGDPAARSRTATLFRLHPNYQAHLRPRPPLRVRLRTSGVPDSHGVTGGVYKARERIHRGMLIRDY